MIERPSPNCEPRPAGQVVDMLVIHYTGMPTAADALSRLCDPQSKVSAHYLIDEDGSVYRLVPEALRAWHAGIGLWPEESLVEPTDFDFDAGLAAYGYDVADPAAAVHAFQRHFRPARVDGRVDDETAGRLAALLELCGQDP